MATITIFATPNTKQTGVLVTDQTDWTTIPGESIDSLSDIKLELYSISLSSPIYTYSLTAGQIATYKSTGSVEVLFSEIMGAVNIADQWYNVRLTTNTNGYISNYSGFGIYSDITYSVFARINSLHTPEEIKYNAEKFCIYAMWRQGLKFLDTTNINSRDIKFNKRLLSLQKMLLKI